MGLAADVGTLQRVPKVIGNKSSVNELCLTARKMRSEEAEIALTTSFLRKSLSVCAMRGQARLTLGRLEVIGPGGAAAALRRNNALQLERSWANQRRADALSNLQGRSILRRGHFRVD